MTDDRGLFSINSTRYEQIKAAILELDAEPTDSEIYDVLFNDWYNASEHQDWLDNAPADEIADWVVEILNFQAIAADEYGELS